MKRKLVPFLTLIWEAVRYALLMNLLQLLLNPLQSPEYGFFFFWLGSYALLPLLGLVLLLLQPGRHGVLAPVVGVGKLLQALAGLLFVLYELGVIPVLLGFLNRGIEGLVPAALLRGAVPAAALMVVLDLISGIVLMRYGAKKSSPPAPQLPPTNPAPQPTSIKSPLPDRGREDDVTEVEEG